MLLMVFSGVSLLLAAVTIEVLAYWVRRALVNWARMALGAEPRRIAGTRIWSGVRVVVILRMAPESAAPWRWPGCCAACSWRPTARRRDARGCFDCPRRRGHARGLAAGPTGLTDSCRSTLCVPNEPPPRCANMQVRASNYRKLGRTNFEVSDIGYGAWGIGGKQWLGGTDDESVLALRAPSNWAST